MRQLESTTGLEKNSAWSSMALAPLKFIERLTLWADYINVARVHREDRWWMRSSEGTLQGPIPLREVRNALLNGASRLSLIHDSQKDTEGAVWLELNQPMLWRHPVFSRLWTIAFWVVLSYALISIGRIFVA